MLMMSNHANGRLVYMCEQLFELYKAKLMTPNPDEI